MQRPNTIYGLKVKRKELRREIGVLLKGIRALDASIALFERPVEKVPRPKSHGRKIFIIDYMRERGGIVTSGELARAWMERSPEKLSAGARRKILNRVRASFCIYERKGYVVQCGSEGTAKLWKLADS